MIYQVERPEQFIHSYSYDADNRLKLVHSSNDNHLFFHEASYKYYLHGPLARTVLGDQSVQGLDYFYTIQGWLKGVNSSMMLPWYDAGRDGWIPPAGSGQTNINDGVGRDAYAFTLSYFEGDYSPVGGSGYQPECADASGWITSFAGELFNGNIRQMTTEIQNIDGALGVAYKYDQLNRLKATDTRLFPDPTLYAWNGSAQDNNAWEEPVISYDRNGNILSYERNDESGQPMDGLSYSYYEAPVPWKNNVIEPTNRLKRVNDQVSGSAHPEDIEDQPVIDNYQYDQIGNLTIDNSEGLSIFWNNFGKVDSIINWSDGTALKFIYDPLGQRIEKRYYPSWAVPEQRNITYYVRDAQGNVMATYSREVDEWMPTDNYRLADWTLYGSSRLGLVKGTEFGTLGSVNGPEWQVTLSFVKNRAKQYELTNHASTPLSAGLGNVLATVSGEKDYLDTTGTGTWSYSIGRVLNAQDYYPFGMPIPGRQVHPEGYRFGFNGQEKDDEIFGSGNNYTAEFWQYSSRLGRRFNIDPRVKSYESPYSCLSNSPLIMIDPRGDDDYYNEKGKFLYTDTKTSNDIRIISQSNFDNINMLYSKEMADKSSSYGSLLRESDEHSRLVTVKNNSDVYRSMWTKSIDYNKEFSGFVILDTKKAELYFKESSDNSKNTKNSGTNDPTYSIDGVRYMTDGEGGIDPFKIVVGNLHTHQEERKYTDQGVSDSDSYSAQFAPGGDWSGANIYGTPRYAIGEKYVDVFNPGPKSNSKNNLTTRSALESGKFNFVRVALENKGGKK